MSKLIISNDIEVTKKIKIKSIKAGFKKFSEFYQSEFNLVAFNKLKIDNENFIKFVNDDFVAIAGTLIYKEKIGKPALYNIYNDFTGEIQKIRKNTIGNYLVIIKKSDDIYIFCEENNLFNVFYCINNDNWFVSNSLFDIADNYPGKLSVNEFNIIEKAFQSAIIGNGTIFNEIKKLQGDEYILIDTKTQKLKIKKELIDKSEIRIDEEELVKEFASALNDKVRIISHIFKDITISMTGGLDSRMIFSSMLANKVSPKLVYGVGNTSLTNTKNRDLEINKIYAERYNLDLKVMNWNTPEKLDQYWEKYMKKYGLLSLIYNASNNVFNELENINAEFIDFGYFGETLRNVPWIENLKKSHFSLDEFLDEFYIEPILKIIYPKYESFRNILKVKFLKICDINKINYLNISKTEFQILHNEYRKNADANLVNFSNMLYYSISILSQKPILDFSYVIPAFWKKNASFMLKTLNEIYPDVLKVPFFSHTKNWVFNEQEFKLIKDNRIENTSNRIIQYVKKLINNDKVFQAIKTVLLPIYHIGYSKKDIIERQARKIIIIKLCNKIKNNEYNIIKPHNFQEYLANLAHYSQILEIIKEIKKK